MTDSVLDVISCGELLIDFVATEAGMTLAEASLFQKVPGGAPANVVVGLARLGRRVGFLGQVGEDEFGHCLVDTLHRDGVDVSAVRFSEQARTALAFVSLLEQGERDFMFYRHPSADMLWRPEDVARSYVERARIVHYGSISLIHEPSRSATLTVLQYARESGALISYDPNLRLPLWPSAEAAKTRILEGWQHAELVKVSEEELLFLTGEQSLERAARALWHERLRLLVVTQGKVGAIYFTPTTSGHVAGFAVAAKDTTGAGDGFVSGLLHGLLMADLNLERSAIEYALSIGNAVGGLVTTRIGAMSALPSWDDVLMFLQK
ncbi:PfkB family carbohydrate kinase [Dictyobacter aurantiacus]|uniref:Fructokinase n=1 Tax=Dictyobacter aurantiacus TaxID=1936993 RepID=A0A401Z9H0_9CHLR|nr:PfkB family carbohydrate kinase [Dictyobacter aurantiacus]GCE03458.1 fructokinase [Dictyobacter aurantiacus]